MIGSLGMRCRVWLEDSKVQDYREARVMVHQLVGLQWVGEGCDPPGLRPRDGAVQLGGQSLTSSFSHCKQCLSLQEQLMTGGWLGLWDRVGFVESMVQREVVVDRPALSTLP